MPFILERKKEMALGKEDGKANNDDDREETAIDT